MRQRQFDIAVEQDKGKGLNLTSGSSRDDWYSSFRTLESGEKDIRVTMMEINVDSDDDGEEETKEFEHPPVEVEVIVVKSDDDFQVWAWNFRMHDV